MKPIKFKECNITFAKNQPPYLPLPAYTDNKRVISCWKLTIKERLLLLFKGKIFVSLLTFGSALQAQKLRLTFKEVKDD